jgi:hypothetical protein
MKKNRIAWLGLLTVVSLLDFAQAAPKSTPPQACKGGTGCAASSCPASITSAQATLPLDACPFEGESQSAVDVFSWNEFIALNWPATTSCTADTTKSILDIKGNNPGPVVWQTLMSSDNVFVAPGQTPAAWCTGDALSALFDKKPRPMGTASKSVSVHNLQSLAQAISQPTGVQAVGGVVTDQSQRWLRYEKLMNQIEYQAVVDNKWYQLSVLNGLPSITLPTGSLELKSSWKILAPQEIAGGRYYTTTAIVYNTPGPNPAPSPGANPVTLGLVGLHIIQKTPNQQGFFWSTFEQVDNNKIFFNPNSKAPLNTQTATQPYTELMQNGTPINAPVQIKRLNKIPADPLLNAYYQKLLAGSVFANYRLISTQWQTGGAPQGTPANVANIVIETYVQQVSSQGKTRNPATGCLACHINATAANNTTTTDHSFMFLEAQ